jgi:uncharacterized membrane protein YcaP (DUF421 family)
MEFLVKIFGEGKDLNVLQISSRAVVVYLIALLLIRIAGRRTFGKKTAFDNTIAIMLGAILSRAVVGASPFLPTVVGSLVLVLLHRVIAWCSIYNENFERLVKGKSRVLFQNGNINQKNMQMSLISENDLQGDVRLKGQTNSMDDIEEICMETTGDLSVIKKKK